MRRTRSRAALASPITHVSAKAPPFLIVHGDKDATVPLVPPKVARVQLPPEDSAAVAAQRALGAAARVVSAFHNVAALKLQKGIPVDCDVLVFGDKPEDREVAIRLAELTTDSEGFIPLARV